MKVFYSILLAISFINLSFGQKLPQQIHQLSNKDTSKVSKILKLAYDLQYKKPEKSLKYAQMALKLAQKQKYEIKQAEIYLLLSNLHTEALEYAKANKNALKSLKIYKKLNRQKNIAQVYEQLGTIYNHLTNYTTALEYHFKALHTFEYLDNKHGIANVLGSIATTYFNLDDYKKSLKYDHKALKIAQKTKDSLLIGRYYAAIAVNYLEMKNYEKSLSNYLKALKYIKPEQSKQSIHLLSQTALVYDYLGNFEEGQKYHQSAWNLVKDQTKSVLFLEYHLDLGESYYIQGKYQKALKHYLEGLQVAQKQNIEFFVYDFYDRIIKTYKQTQDYDKAFVFQEKFISLKDSIYNQNNSRQINEMQEIYESNKKEEQIKLQKTELKQQQTQNLLLIVAILFIFIFASYLFYTNRQRLYKNKLLASQKEEITSQNETLISLDNFKEQMTGMIVHDLKNPLNSIISLSESENLAQKEHQIIHQSGQQMLTMVSNMLDVYKFEESEIQLELENSSLNQIVNLALTEIKFLAKQKSLIIINEIQAEYLLSIDIELIKRVFVNILTNAIKYSSNNSKIWLKVEELEDQEVKIFIQDEGIGISKENQVKIFEKFSQVNAKNLGKTRSTGLGLTFCKMVIEAHEGKIGVVSEEGKGTSFWFTIKANRLNESTQAMNEPITQSFNYSFTQKEQEYLEAYLLELKKLDLYEASKIIHILENVRKQASVNIQNWADELENTVFTYNEDLYKNLVNI